MMVQLPALTVMTQLSTWMYQFFPRRVRSALGEIIIEGVETNVDYQYEILNHPVYLSPGHHIFGIQLQIPSDAQSPQLGSVQALQAFPQGMFLHRVSLLILRDFLSVYHREAVYAIVWAFFSPPPPSFWYNRI